MEPDVIAADNNLCWSWGQSCPSTNQWKVDEIYSNKTGMIYVYLQFYLFWFDKAFLFNIKLIYYIYFYVFSRTCMSDALVTVIMRLGITTRYKCKYFWAYRAATVNRFPGAAETAVISIWSVSHNDEIKFRLDNSHVP